MVSSALRAVITCMSCSSGAHDTLLTRPDGTTADIAIAESQKLPVSAGLATSVVIMNVLAA